MFDKILFDRNAFDRSVSSEGINLTILGTGKMDLRINVRMPNGGAFTGSGNLSPKINVRQNLVKTFSGSGEIGTVPVTLRRPSAAHITGSGALGVNFIVRTPISAKIGGSGGLSVSSNMFVYQQMKGTISGSGKITPNIVMATNMSSDMHGYGELTSKASLWLPIVSDFAGHGTLSLRRLSTLNENAIELIDINFLPGETIIIDTDLLQVLFGSMEDVSSVTKDSVFFELSPGENEIVIEVDDMSATMDVIAIWQNRWL